VGAGEVHAGVPINWAHCAKPSPFNKNSKNVKKKVNMEFCNFISFYFK
jgi:hypothetical protein